MAGSSRKAVVVALISNAAIVIVKIAAFLITGSASMFSEALHSVADTVNQGLLMIGMSRSSKPGDKKHPFGYSKEQYFVAFVVAAVLFGLGSVTAVEEGITKLQHPHEFASPIVAVVVLVASIGLESISLMKAFSEARDERIVGESVLRFVRRTKIADLPVILLEDIGAITGLVIALIGTLLTLITHDERFDALGSVAIGILLGLIAIFLGLEMRSLLIGEAADPKVDAAIRSAILHSDAISEVVHLKTLHLGPADLLVATKVIMDADLRLSEIAKEINQAELRLRKAVPIARLVYIEPDIHEVRSS